MKECEKMSVLCVYETSPFCAYFPLFCQISNNILDTNFWGENDFDVRSWIGVW
jgi:hypothetical protein